MIHPDVMASLLQMSRIRSQFLAWLAAETPSEPAWLETLELKSGGASGSALKRANKKSRLFVSKATSNGNSVATFNNNKQYSLKLAPMIALHWVDNYSKFYKASGKYSEKHLVQNAL